MRRILPLLLAGIAFMLLLDTADVAAQDDEARIHFSSGASYYARGEYERALEEFQMAQQMSGRAELFFNIALCYQQLGDLPRAVEALQRFLNEAQNVPDRPTLEARLLNMQNRIREREAAAAAAAANVGQSVPEQSQEATPAPDEERAPDRPPPPVYTYIGFGAAGLGVAGMATFGGLALANRNSIADGCGEMRACTQSDVETMDRLALLADISMGITIAGAAVGILGLVLPRDGGDDDAATVVVPVVEARSGTVGLMVGGRF